MKALCITPERTLVLRDIPIPTAPADGHVLVDMRFSAINHGDKTFLVRPDAAGRLLSAGQHDVWGASGSGTVVSVGSGVPETLLGRHVALYRSLRRSEHQVGLWCERAHVPEACCVPLPDTVDPRDYSGSLVNAITAFSFLERIAADGHRNVIATAGRSATARALAALAERRGMPAILLTREPIDASLVGLNTRSGTTAVFDGLGGAALSRLLPVLPRGATIYCYGFLDGAAVPVSFPTALLMQKELTLTRFSNFDSDTVTDPLRLDAARTELAAVIGDPAFRTRIGREFAPEQIDAAMAFETTPGAKAVLRF